MLRLEHLGQILECSAIFVMGVEQHHMAGRVAGENLAQDQRHGTALARAGGAENGKMLRQQVVDHDEGRRDLVLMDGADLHVGRLGLGIDHAHIARLRRGQGQSQGRHDRHAALEMDASRFHRCVKHFAHQVDLGDVALERAARSRLDLRTELGYHAENRRDRCPQFDQLADTHRIAVFEFAVGTVSAMAVLGAEAG